MSSVRHAIDVLQCISVAPAPLGVNEIARRVGLHKSSVSRLVATLETHHLVQRDPTTDRIGLGVGLIALAAPLLADLEIRDVARPLLARLANETGETVSFSVWDGTEAVSIEQVVGPSPVRAFEAPGRRNAGHCSAAGKMLLATQPDGAIDKYCAHPLDGLTENTITDPKALREELRAARSLNYAHNFGETERDIGAVSSPVRDRHGRVLGVVTATVPIYRFGPERRAALTELVVGAAAEMSGRLGHAGREGA